jgi:ribonuclease-3
MSLTQKLKILQLDLEYEFNNLLLIEEALTHSSSDLNYNNERLEFLGDRVLGLVVAKILLDEFPLDNEGDIGRRFSQLVMGDTLTDIAYRIGLDKLIILRGVKVNNNIMADTMEAVIASLYLDGGFSVAEKFIYKYWEPLVKMLDVPPKEGPDHDPIFTVEVCIPLVGTSTARGNNKQSAEQKAAQNLLFELGIINDNKTY